MTGLLGWDALMLVGLCLVIASIGYLLVESGNLRVIGQWCHGVCFALIVRKNTVLLRLMGAQVGRGVKARSAFSVSCPSRIVIGDGVWIGSNVTMYAEAGIIIGDGVLLAKDVSLISADHDMHGARRPVTAGDRPIRIGQGSWICEKAIILKGVEVGEGAVVGAGAVVTKDVPAFALAVGNPARVIRETGGRQ